MSERLTTAEILSRRWEGLPPEIILAEASETFAPGRLAISSAFGPASLVLMHLAAESGLRLPVLFVDTLHHFPETLEHVQRVRDRYDLDLRVFSPAVTRAEFEAQYGERLWERDIDLYQRVSKVEPFRRATADFDAWFTGRQREQSATRADLPLVDGTDKFRINPLADWTRGQVWHYILDRGIPYNPLHDRGYTSIGDEPLTTPAGADEDERAGRWRGNDITECGIHFV